MIMSSSEINNLTYLTILRALNV